ncbi:2-polyprenyl-6-methoxyphenol hydroxylase [Terribacillus aidingensis]|uniref:2-polyprenyl-6-methoxyphenol hydroxylase n=1 Tax=Terribacillus aidingensis TaxID=586416 RepID=A0A285NKY8_9BACI|nr:FAD-dependent monooxygenase [Terribacillus aidingensis]SNZ10160.1 2-polyprenyl-6-methoxyphenol hydroxylase [Terribacillus aidingensis]
MELKPKVLIIGAGVAGLTLSIFLKRAGIESVVYEASVENQNSGAGFVLSPNGIRVLESLGVQGEILKRGSRLIHDSTHGLKGEEIMRSTFDTTNSGFDLLSLNRYDLCEVLLSEAKKQGINVIYNKKLIDVTQSYDHVNAHFQDGSFQKGDLLVGADGVHSKTRRITFPEMYLDYTGLYGIQGLAPSNSYYDEMLFEKSISFTDFKKDFYVFVSRTNPKSKNGLLWQALGKKERKYPTNEFEQLDSENIKKRLLQQIEDWENPFVDILKQTTSIHPRSLYTLKNITHWSRDRIVLIGDAIHTTNPILGQGASWSLEDGMYLAKMLSKHSYRDAFYFFEYDRRKRIEFIKEHVGMSIEDLSFSHGGAFETAFNYSIEWEDSKVK